MFDLFTGKGTEKQIFSTQKSPLEIRNMLNGIVLGITKI
jgi:hypothetical protein